MTSSQFQTLVEMFNRLNRRIDDVRDELKKEMAEGFARQEAIVAEQFRAAGFALSALETDHQTAKQNLEKRLLKLEKRTT